MRWTDRFAEFPGHAGIHMIAVLLIVTEAELDQGIEILGEALSLATGKSVVGASGFPTANRSSREG
ncbi:MAG: hypothetical protein NTY63_04130 [Candidatus Bipolaricaulota bacterium]|nr:hypothetical protein [Candidatus Bipolaricaulota bacterium]